MDAPTVAAVAAVIAVLLTVLNIAFGGGWRLKREMADMEKTLSGSIADARTEIEERQNNIAQPFSDTLLAMREHMNKIQLESAQLYVRRDDFQEFRNDLREDLKTNFAEIKASIRDLSGYIKNGHS